MALQEELASLSNAKRVRWRCQSKLEIKFFDLKKFDLKRSGQCDSETRNLEVTLCVLKLHMPSEPFRAT